MILIKISAALLCLGWLGVVSGASFSKVYVHSGADNRYVNTYGAPLAYQGNQLAQLSAAPVGSVLPLPQVSNFVGPCIAPCIPAQSIAPVANSGLIAYKAANPVVVANNDPTSYEYSYAVFDENTGDQKWQKELSDGVVVRGQYSLVQPDGYVREVQYTADDATGFNAIVKKFLPEGEGKAIVIKKAEPCEPKAEALKEKKEETSHEEHAEEAPKAEEPAHAEETKAEEPHKEEAAESKEAPASSEAPGSAETHDEAPASAEAPASVEPAASAEAPTSAESHEDVKQEEHAPEPTPAVVVEVHEAVSAEVKEEPKPIDHSKETPEEHAAHTEVQPVPVLPIIAQQPPQTFVLANQPGGDFISYNQLLKCIQSMKISEQRSPLSYILLPSNPC